MSEHLQWTEEGAKLGLEGRLTHYNGRRLCACGCGASLAGLRSDAVYASDACRKRAQRAYSADKGRTRRPSRDGTGAKVYLTPAELRTVQVALHYLPATRRVREVEAKLDRARERAGPLLESDPNSKVFLGMKNDKSIPH